MAEVKKKVTRKRWTEQDDELIWANYPGHGALWPMWAELLPDRNAQAIRARAHRLGVKHRWPEGGVDAKPAEKDATKEGAEAIPEAVEWAREQRRGLVVGFAMLQIATGHTAAECAVEMVRLLEKRAEKGGSGDLLQDFRG